MNKQELVNKIAEEANLSKKDASAALDVAVSTIMNAVNSGEKVTLVGFGTFSQTTKIARKGRNPQTGKEISIPEKKAPKFSAGQTFKNLVK